MCILDEGRFTGAVAALPGLLLGAAGNGALNFVPDSDGVVRRVPLLLRMERDLVPSLSAETLRVAQGVQNYVTRAPVKPCLPVSKASAFWRT